MRKFAVILFFGVIVLKSYSQTEEEKRKQEILTALKEWFKNPSAEKKILDPEIVKSLTDNGKKENGIKTGQWIEFSLESPPLDSTKVLIVQDTTRSPYPGPKIQKETGKYVKGKREGLWVLFSTYEACPSFYWERKKTTNYKDGEKEGEEIIYQGFGNENQHPLTITHFKQGKQNGLVEIYNHYSPYKLVQKSFIINKRHVWDEVFSPNGNIAFRASDTVINNNLSKYIRRYYENGPVRECCFRNSNGELSESYKKFF